jgi:hypothetical protein
MQYLKLIFFLVIVFTDKTQIIDQAKDSIGRRVVTDFNVLGKSMILMDGSPPKATTYKVPWQS